MEETLDIAGHYMWNRVCYQFLEKNLKKNLTKINLSTNHISVESSKLLSKLISSPYSSVRMLNLTRCRMTVSATVHLLQGIANSKVLQLILDYNYMSNQCCEVLKETLIDDPPLQYLSLVGCDISSDGCVLISDALTSNSRLLTLKLDGNNIFDRGAESLAQNIPKSAITALSVSDCQIWMPATTTLISSVSKKPNFTSLDVSYNIVDLSFLSSLIHERDNIVSLSVSGCKVNESHISKFLESIVSSNLRTLLIDGFNFNMLPISWPHVTDTIWKNPSYFDILFHAMKTMPSLIDIRLGFLEMEQLGVIYDQFCFKGSTKDLALSIQDFGHTKDCWVLFCPEGRIEAPSSVFKWSSPMNVIGAQHIHKLFRVSRFENENMKMLDLSNCSIDNVIATRIAAGFDDMSIRSLDLSQNTFDDVCIDSLLDFINRTSFEDIKILESKISDTGLNTIFQYLVDNDYCPDTLNLSFVSENTGDDLLHPFSETVSKLIMQNRKLRKLSISGNVTVSDVIEIIKNLKHNSTLESIEFDSTLQESISISSKQEDPKSISSYKEVVESLRDAFNSPDSICNIKQFKYPALTSVFLISEEVLTIWGEFEQKLLPAQK